MTADVLLKARGVKKYFPVRKGVLKRTVGQLQAVDGVDLDVFRGETVGLVGESGCGKSTLGRTLIRLLEPTAGEIEFDGVDMLRLGGSDLKAMRRHMQIVFQDSVGSLDPRMTVSALVGEGLRIHGFDRKLRERTVIEVLERVGLSAGAAGRYPHQFSGGQRQRIGLARALVLTPKFIVADEPVSALDVSIQSQVLNLLVELKEDFNLTYLFVAHDLAVVGYISDRVAVMYLGKIVELATSEELFRRPLHPYTVALLSANPEPVPGRKRQRVVLAGDVPSPINPPSGCRFRTRCPIAQPICAEVEPLLEDHGAGHRAACHFAGSPLPETPSLIDAPPLTRERRRGAAARGPPPARPAGADARRHLAVGRRLPAALGRPAPDHLPVDAVRVDAGALRRLGRLVRAARLRRRRLGRARPLRVGGRVRGVEQGRRRRSGLPDLGGRRGVVQRPHRHVGAQLRRARPVAAAARGAPEPRVRRAAGDPRRLLLGRLLDGWRLPARAHAGRRRPLDERDQPDHRPERARPDPERPCRGATCR